jgi:hypothetical protein
MAIPSLSVQADRALVQVSFDARRLTRLSVAMV